MSLTLNKVSESTSNITLGWTPPIGAEWYLFYANGKRVSNAPAIGQSGAVKKTIVFSKGSAPYEVVAVTRRNGVMGVEAGKYPATPTNSDQYSKDPYSSGAYSR